MVSFLACSSLAIGKINNTVSTVPITRLQSKIYEYQQRESEILVYCPDKHMDESTSQFSVIGDSDIMDEPAFVIGDTFETFENLQEKIKTSLSFGKERQRHLQLPQRVDRHLKPDLQLKYCCGQAFSTGAREVLSKFMFKEKNE